MKADPRAVHNPSLIKVVCDSCGKRMRLDKKRCRCGNVYARYAS